MPVMELQASPDSLKATRAFLQLTQNPANFEAIYDLDEVLTASEISQISITYLQSHPDVAAAIADRYLAPIPDLDALLTYPSDSLGYQFAHHLKTNGFDPNFYRPRLVHDDLSYINLRRSQTHDICHVVTGFGTSLADEIGLQAFQLAQMRSPLAIALLSSSLVHTLNAPDQLNAIMLRIHQGWQLGRQAKPFFAQRWEEQWEKPLMQWRAELNVEPVSAIAP